MNSDAKLHDEWLAANGWKESPVHKTIDRHARDWFKRVETKVKCACNENPRGIQVRLKQWDFSQFPTGGFSWEIEIVGETHIDSQWVNFTAYAIQNESLLKAIEEMVPRMIRAWEAVNEDN